MGAGKGWDGKSVESIVLGYPCINQGCGGVIGSGEKNTKCNGMGYSDCANIRKDWKGLEIGFERSGCCVLKTNFRGDDWWLRLLYLNRCDLL